MQTHREKKAVWLVGGFHTGGGCGAARRPAGDGTDSDATMASQTPSPDGHHGHMGVSTGEPTLFYCPTRIMRPSFSSVHQYTPTKLVWWSLPPPSQLGADGARR